MKKYRIFLITNIGRYCLRFMRNRAFAMISERANPLHRPHQQASRCLPKHPSLLNVDKLQLFYQVNPIYKAIYPYFFFSFDLEFMSIFLAAPEKKHRLPSAYNRFMK